MHGLMKLLQVSAAGWNLYQPRMGRLVDSCSRSKSKYKIQKKKKIKVQSLIFFLRENEQSLNETDF